MARQCADRLDDEHVEVCGDAVLEREAIPGERQRPCGDRAARDAREAVDPRQPRADASVSAMTPGLSLRTRRSSQPRPIPRFSLRGDPSVSIRVHKMIELDEEQEPGDYDDLLLLCARSGNAQRYAILLLSIDAPTKGKTDDRCTGSEKRRRRGARIREPASPTS